MTTASTLPVVVVGAGPVGLAAAANLIEREMPFVILEAGSMVGSSVAQWGHIQMFSPWRYTIDEASARLLGEKWSRPAADSYPFGADLVKDYLAPLAEVPAIAAGLRLGTTVTSVTRKGMDRSQSKQRDGAPFVVTVDTASGPTSIEASAVIDASGTWRTPNPARSTGVVGDGVFNELTAFHAPDLLGADRADYAGKSVGVIGSGHTAQNVLRNLVRLQKDEPSTKVTWLIRRGAAGQLFGGGDADELPERGALGSTVSKSVDEGHVQLVMGFRTASVSQEGTAVVVTSENGQAVSFDRLVVATGSRPDYSMASELRLDLDPVTEATRALGPLVDPSVHSCGSVEPHGHRELAHPEKNFYTVGMKSYGRAPTFLLPTGYEQARSVVAAIDGDFEAADQVFFDLPETGVCSGGPASEDFESEGAGCCGPEIVIPASTTEEACCTPKTEDSVEGACCTSNPVLATSSATNCC